MARAQFTTRQLLMAVTMISVAFGAIIWFAHHSPESFVYACAGSFAVGLFGVGFVVLAGIMALSVYVSPDEVDRKLNLAKCANLALIGTFMIGLPILLVVTTFVLLPLLQRA